MAKVFSDVFLKDRPEEYKRSCGKLIKKEIGIKASAHNEGLSSLWHG
jgi:hypothetical protein